ncbi:NADH:ubiquinone oxidoreductase subunit 4 (chain M) (NuoM) (PDB:6HUM) [Commensalibacter communis]|uniref:complex I subunit 4 family protein n=1 Tax=Commensalibacter communis TaxID=2972786 RepID=UPI0022FF94B2|nr:NADH-quinone oxidoreductase subunit M [Commensalibacter communis]CAI3927177.1 NADH:ubiquinone oxidoreductase subunit 4 (chain M) (NuoM) (PDB:6HUM) [Commensalibacter communis]
MHTVLLTLVTYLPLLGALIIFLMRGSSEEVARTARWIALWTSVVVFGLSIVMWSKFDPTLPGYQFDYQSTWLEGYGVSYHVGVDGISLFFIILSTLLTLVAILAAWQMIIDRIRDYMVAILLLETTLVGLFSSLDMVVFYCFYEATLIPSSMLIGIWGGPKRIFASLTFFLFTFTGSLFMMIGILWIWVHTGTTDIPVLMHQSFSGTVQGWLLLGFVLAFGVKLPLFPLHSWLPNAYSEAPAPTTLLVSGVMSKAGAYGLLRFCILMLPEASHRYSMLIMILGVCAVIYGAVIALAQTDIKRMVAYSSFSHMGLIAIGLFSFTAEGINGALMQVISHGVTISALFLCIAAVTYRAETRSITEFGGVASQMPKLALLGMIFIMANVGLPGTGAFVGELLVMVGALQVSFWIALLGGSTMILGAIYTLVLYRKVIFGAVVKPAVSHMRDLSVRELTILVPLALITLWMGIYPNSFLSVFDPAVVSFTSSGRVAELTSQVHTVAVNSVDTHSAVVR